MSMSRADSASYLAGTLAQWLTDAGLTAADTSGNLKEPIDDALLMTGTTYSDLTTATVADTDVPGFRKVLKYTGLLRIQDAIGSRVDLQLDGPQMSKSRSQAVKSIAEIIKTAKESAEPFITTSGAWSQGTVALDYLEPEAV